MRLILIGCLTMVMFASNSALNRLAFAEPGMGPGMFAAIRLLAGAAALGALMALRGARPTPSWPGAISLFVYAIGFSFAYITLETGAGALILFGVVQITMFAGALIEGAEVPPRRWVGSGFGLLGLAILLWPVGGSAPSLVGAGLMTVSALGWGIYSLLGQKATDPLAATAGNFLFTAPAALILGAVAMDGITRPGIVFAVISGAVTSGLGYALWYSIVPHLGATRAALTQLTVPLIAAAGGLILLAEPMTWRFGLASLLVLGGVAFGLLTPKQAKT